MKVNFLILTALLIFSSIVGCKKKHESTEQPSSTTIDSEKTDSLSYTFKDFSRKYGDCNSDTSAYCTEIILNYPQFDTLYNSGAAQIINEKIEKHVLADFASDSSGEVSLDKYADTFIADYKEVKETFGEAFGWYIKLNGQVLRNDTAVISIVLASDMYTGGAHGSYSLQYLNYNPQTGDSISLSSLFNPGYEKKLNQIVEKKFRTKYKISPDTDLSDEGYEFENGEYFNPGNFAILNDGIKFFYNSYEIAAYAKGPSEVRVSFDELKEILKQPQSSIIMAKK